MASGGAFWKPSPGAGDDLLADDRDATAAAGTVHISSYPLERRQLPIAARRTQLLYALEQYGVVVLVGETG